MLLVATRIRRLTNRKQTGTVLRGRLQWARQEGASYQKGVEVGRDYKISVELNMTYSQFCTEWNANEFLDTLMRPADDGPDENISHQGMNLC